MKIINNSKNPTPSYATDGASGIDIRAYIVDMPNCVTLPDGSKALLLEPNHTYMIPTGLHFEIPVGMEGQLRPRSGIATKYDIIMPNSVGTIDSDYRGEVKVPMRVVGDKPYLLSNGERVAQLIIAPYIKVDIEVVDKLGSTDRGDGGFGHTGKL